MSIAMEQAADAILQAAEHISSQDELSELDVDGDGSSSLSDIEEKDPEQEEDAEGSDELSSPSDDENDSEAETERLEESPNKSRTQKDVVLNSHSDDQIYARNPSKIHNQIITDDMEIEEDDGPLSDDDHSLAESPDSAKSSNRGNGDKGAATIPTSLEDSSVESRKTLSVVDADTRKRKRSIMAGGGLDDDLEEPSRKRTGSVMTPGDDYAIEDDINPEDDGVVSNPQSGNISGDDGDDVQEEAQDDVEESALPEEEPQETETPTSPKRRGRKKKKVVENGNTVNGDSDSAVNGAIIHANGHGDTRNGDEDTVDIEGDDEAEAALRNEEELEKKRMALEQLSAIERQFATFRDRLYDERLDQLSREEAMLRQSKPSHPEYLAMMQCIDARRDERLRVANKLKEYGLQSIKTFAVGKRSQILSQYLQEVRDLREKQLEQLGKQWYEIQHDRRSYAGSIPDYTLNFPRGRSQQLMNQAAYSHEVSILSGIAKYVGFPAAPPMASATASELEEDFEKMGRTKQALHPQPTALPLHELAALRTAGSTSRFKPAEEQFIEQTPWANPQHPSHAHLLQRQASAQLTPRTTSPFSHTHAPPRRHSHQANGPISGTFSNTSFMHTQGVGVSGGRISPLNAFAAAQSHVIVPSPLGGSRQTSLSPQQGRAPPIDSKKHVSIPPDAPTTAIQPPPKAQPHVFQQATAIMGQF